MTANGELVTRPADDVRTMDHRALGVRRNRWRWAAGAPDEVMWTGEKDDAEDAVEAWLAKRGIVVRRHRHFPDGYGAWSARVQASPARRAVESVVA